MSIDAKWIMERLTGRWGEQVELAQAMGISTDKLNKILAGKRRVQASEIDAVQQFFGGVLSVTGTPTSPNDTLVPVYNVQASAGHGAIVADEYVISQISFPPGYLQKLTRADPRNLKIIGVKGDSMLPSLSDDDVVMLDTSKRDLSFDGLFVIRDDGDGLLVKRIGRAGRKGFVMVISDNPLYPTAAWATSDIEVIGKVIWTGRKV